MEPKQLLILTESIDLTADKVCQWLNYYHQPFLRINSDIDFVWVEEVKLSSSGVTIVLGHKSGVYSITDFSIIWFRRGQLVNTFREISNNIYPDDPYINLQINNHLNNELEILNEFVYRHLSNLTRQINNPLNYNINKLECLYLAGQYGLKVPDTLITRSKSKVKDYTETQTVITKNLSDILVCLTPYFHMTQGTSIVRSKDIGRVRNRFFPSLFQAAVKKKADIRVFFIMGEVFSSAIYDFSNSDIDFRSSKNMVAVPFKLPNETGTALLQLAKHLGLESGSADFVLSTDDELHFLEINPVGQIDFVSHLTNGYYEKRIAKILINYGKN